MRLLVLALALLSFSTRASAHRTDEYLQATTIDVKRDRIDLRLILTPGVSVAPRVLAMIDADHDGAISPAERLRYVERVRNELDLNIDSAAGDLRLLSSSFAPASDMRIGVGDIVLTFTARIAPATAHHLVLSHPQRSDTAAVYLVNTLQPEDPAIQIGAQERSYDQRRYRLEFTVGSGRPDRQSVAEPGTAGPPGESDAAAVIATFLEQGVRHILTGYDHLLFVAALVLGAATLRDLVKVVTVFTVAHSLTLALGALRLVYLPEALLEPVIAASIVAVAVQNIARPDQARGASRLMIAFVFGLFHGLGFAGGLLEVMHRLPDGTVMLAILGFSLGVEAGNQIVLLPAYGATRLAVRWREADRDGPSPRSVQQIGSAAIAAAGVAYLAAAMVG